MQQPNSRQVKIYRLSDFLTRAQGSQIQDFLSLSKEGIGAYFQPNSPAIGTGLTNKEIELLMPILLQVSADDKTFRAEVNKFFNSIDTKVDFQYGTTLEIGLEDDNAAPVSEKNMPINIMEYIRYRHALKHPQVSADKESGHGNQTKRFYIFDPEAVSKLQDQAVVDSDKALETYLAIAKDEKKVDILLTLFGEDVRKYGKLTDKQKKLREIADKKPGEFIKTAEGDHIEDRAWVRQMVLADQIKVIGGSYHIKSSMQFLGKSEEEAIMTLKSPDMTEVVMILKGNTQENLKAQNVAAKKKK